VSARVRLQDVADRAGVSVKTVSNVVHGYLHVATATRARVQAVLDETGYRPNLSARQLRTGRTGVIALALPELDNPYFAELTGFVVEAAEEYGWTVLVDQTDGRRERELAVSSGFRHHLIDGLILSPVALGVDDLAQRSPDDTPVVLLGEKLAAGPADHVAIDNVAAARVATEHLLAGGRHRVAVIGHQPNSSQESGVAHLRLRGWEEALAGAGLPALPGLVREVPTFRREDGATAMTALLESGDVFDAVFCFNDTLALGALRVLADWGLRVPEDVAVMGLDDVADGRFAIPTLSTIAPDKEGIARTAVRMLAERLDAGGQEIAPRDIRAAFELVVRESTTSRVTTTSRVQWGE
jgi:DNA-binding LacI/PurR family transcriptional regulator